MPPQYILKCELMTSSFRYSFRTVAKYHILNYSTIFSFMAFMCSIVDFFHFFNLAKSVYHTHKKNPPFVIVQTSSCFTAHLSMILLISFTCFLIKSLKILFLKFLSPPLTGKWGLKEVLPLNTTLFREVV